MLIKKLVLSCFWSLREDHHPLYLGKKLKSAFNIGKPPQKCLELPDTTLKLSLKSEVPLQKMLILHKIIRKRRRTRDIRKPGTKILRGVYFP